MPRFSYTIEGVVQAPEGARLEGNMIVMPDGKTYKPWETWERGHVDDPDAVEDIGFDEMQDAGFLYDGDAPIMEEIEETDQIWPRPS